MYKTALCYVRKSLVKTGGAAPASPELQERECRAAAERLGMTAELFVDADGHRSGKTANRPGWQACISRMAAADVGALIVYSHDRAFRNLRELLALADDCQRRGVRLVLVREALDVATANGRFMLSLLGAFGEFESNIAGERRAESIDYLRRERGRHYGLAPFGTVRERRGADLVLVPDARPQPNGTDHDALVAAYELYAGSHMGFRPVADMLNRYGWRYRDRHGQLREWRRDDVRRVFASHWIYSGYVTVGRAHRGASVEILPGSHAPILPAALIEPIALRLEQSHKLGARQRRPYLYPLTGLLYCACGGALKGAYTWGARRYMHETRCRDGRPWYVRADLLEDTVRAHLAGLRLPDTVRADVAGDVLARMASEHGPDAEAERLRLHLAIERLAELYADGAITRAQYDRQRAVYLAQLPAERAPSAASPLAGLPPLADAVAGAPPELLRDMLRALYARIVWNGERLDYTPLEWCAAWA